MPHINFNKTKAALTTLRLGMTQGCSKVLSSCKTVAKVTSSSFKNFFNKKAVVDGFPINQGIRVPSLEGPNPLIEDISQKIKKPVRLYKKFTGKMGDLAEKIANKGPSLENKIPSLDQIDFWKSLDPALQLTKKHFPTVFLELTNRNKREEEITEKLESLLPCLQKFSLPRLKLPTKFTASDIASIDSIIKQLRLIDLSVVAFIQGTTTFSENEKYMLVEAHHSISDLQNLLKEYKAEVHKPIHEEDKKFAENKLKNNPLLVKLVPLTVASVGSVLSAFTIDQEGLLPAGVNPSNLLSKTLSKTVSLLSNPISSLKDLSFPSMPLISADILQNATMIAGNYALATLNDDSNEEEQQEYSRYMINILVNHIFMCSFAYLGSRVCGSKVKVKEFVEQRISSVLMYKVCNASLACLSIPFWPNKAISTIASSIANPLINLFSEDKIS
ncbi:MAG: hypothetical protein ACRCU0_02625 [Candidatus Rhabdochlamydia sp.]